MSELQTFSIEEINEHLAKHEETLQEIAAAHSENLKIQISEGAADAGKLSSEAQRLAAFNLCKIFMVARPLLIFIKTIFGWYSKKWADIITQLIAAADMSCTIPPSV